MTLINFLLKFICKLRFVSPAVCLYFSSHGLLSNCCLLPYSVNYFWTRCIVLYISPFLLHMQCTGREYWPSFNKESCLFGFLTIKSGWLIAFRKLEYCHHRWKLLNEQLKLRFSVWLIYAYEESIISYRNKSNDKTSINTKVSNHTKSQNKFKSDMFSMYYFFYSNKWSV